MEWRQRNEWNVEGGSGVRSTDSLVKIGKWSDEEQWVTDRDGASEESDEVENVILVVSLEIYMLC